MSFQKIYQRYKFATNLYLQLKNSLMKKVYSWLLLAIMSAIALSAHANSYQVYIDNPDNIEFYENWVDISSQLSAGNNTRNFDQNQIAMQIKAKNGATITSATLDGNAIANLSFFYVKNGNKINITTSGGTTAEPQYFYVDIVDGTTSDVKLTHEINYIPTQIQLTSLTNNRVEFTSGESFTFNHSNWQKKIYEVKVGDTPLTPTATGSFVYNPKADGEHVYVTVNAPIIKFPVHFDLSDGATGLFTKIEVDGTEVADWNGKDDLNVETGKTVAIYLDSENYSIESLKKDGYTISYPDGKCEFTVERETTISAVAHRYGEYDLTINTTGKDYIKAYIGSPITGQEITLDDKTTLKISEKNNVVTIVPRTSSHISMVKLNGTELIPNDNNEYTAAIVTNSTLEIQAGAIIRDKSAYVYVNDALYAQDLYIVNKNSDINISINDLQAWYREVKFSELDNPFSIIFLPDLNEYIEVRQNYTKLEIPQKDGNGNIVCPVTLSDGDIIQIYLNSTAVDRNVTFNIGETVEGFTLTRDIIKNVTDLTSPLTVPDGTLLKFTTTSTEIECSVNGEKLDDVNGTFSVQVNGSDLTIDIVDLSQQGGGIDNITTGTESETEWFTLTGIRLSSHPQASGVYICRSAGKASKVLVK